MWVDNPEIQSCVNEKLPSNDTELIMSWLGLQYNADKKEIKNIDTWNTIKLWASDWVDPNWPEVEFSFGFTQLGNWLYIDLFQFNQRVNTITVQDWDSDIWGLRLSKPADIYSIFSSVEEHWSKIREIQRDCEKELSIQKLISDFQDSWILQDLPSLQWKAFAEIINIPEQTGWAYRFPSINYSLLNNNEQRIATNKWWGHGNLTWSNILNSIALNIEELWDIIPFPIESNEKLENINVKRFEEWYNELWIQIFDTSSFKENFDEIVKNWDSLSNTDKTAIQKMLRDYLVENIPDFRGEEIIFFPDENFREDTPSFQLHILNRELSVKEKIYSPWDNGEWSWLYIYMD